MDIQSATQVAETMRRLVRRSANFGKSREDILDELLMIAEDYDNLADRIDNQMSMESEVA